MLKVISFFFKSSWRIILFAAIGSAVSASLNLIIFKFLTIIVKEPEHQTWISIVWIALLSIASAVLTIYLSKYVTSHFEHKTILYRRLLSKRILKVNYQKIEKQLDKLVTILLFEVSILGDFGKSISGALLASFQSLAVLGYLFFISWKLTVLIFIVLIIQGVVNINALPQIKLLEKKISNTRFKLHFSLDRMEKGLKDLFLSSRHSRAYIKNSVDQPGQQLANEGVALNMLKTKIDALLSVLVLVSIGCVLILALSYFDIEQPVLIEYLALLLFIVPSANILFGFLKSMKNVQNAQDQVELFDVDLRAFEEVKEGCTSIDKDYDGSLISVKNVVFTYGGTSNFQLGPVNFDISRNEIVIINGGNGSGKSTLFKIITGLYWPEQGQTYFQGQELSVDNIQGYRDLYCAYFTDTPVFDDLTYLDFEKVEARGVELIEKLELTGKVSLDRINHITESGLSHGQKGRLNLLRLLLQDNEIFFLDEWAANQDVHFKQIFYEEIVPSLKAKGKTVILISHDDKYYHVADKIISLKNGGII